MALSRAAYGERLRRLLPGVWLGWMLCVALLGTPSAFALLTRAEAGQIVARLLAGEAYVALGFGTLLLVLERLAARRYAVAGLASHDPVRRSSVFSTSMLLCLAALFCTVAGYFAVLPLMERARAGQGALGFGQLHAISAAFFIVKLSCVAALAWRGTGTSDITLPPSS